RQIHALGAGAGVENAEEVKISGDVHFFGVIAGIGLDQVEKQIVIAFGKRGKRFVRAVDGDIAGLVAEFYQRFENLFAIMLLAALGLLLGAGLFLFRLRLDL